MEDLDLLLEQYNQKRQCQSFWTKVLERETLSEEFLSYHADKLKNNWGDVLLSPKVNALF